MIQTEQFNKLFNKKTLKLMEAVSNPNFDKYAQGVIDAGGGYDSLNEGIDPNTLVQGSELPEELRTIYDEDGEEGQEEKFSNTDEGRVKRQNQNLKEGRITDSGKQMPSAIRESMLNNPIEISTEGMPGTSIVDDRRFKEKFGDIQKIQEANKKKKKAYSEMMNEQKQIIQTATPAIDYSLIKTIVEDTVQKYASALKKQILSEAKLNDAGGGNAKLIKIGDKVQFLTDNGDLYEAVLTFKKNINTKKGA